MTRNLLVIWIALLSVFVLPTALVFRFVIIFVIIAVATTIVVTTTRAMTIRTTTEHGHN